MTSGMQAQISPGRDDASESCSNTIRLRWSGALSPQARQTKYDAFMRSIPPSLAHLWNHEFEDDGAIVSIFSTRVTGEFFEMRRSVDIHASKSSYAYSECTVTCPFATTSAFAREDEGGCLLNPKQTRKTQTVIANPKSAKPPRHLQEKWDKEKLERSAQREKNELEYYQRLEMDQEFAQLEEKRIVTEKLRKQALRDEAKQKKSRDAEVMFLFGKIWGEERWEDLRQLYINKVGCKYMPVGEYKFFSGSKVLEFCDMFHEAEWLGRSLPFIQGMPTKNDWRFRQWYRNLPIHPMFVSAESTQTIHVGGSNDTFLPFRYIDRQIYSSDDSSAGEEEDN